MSGKKVTLLVFGIIAAILLLFSFQQHDTLRFKTCDAGAIFYERRPPPYLAPQAGRIFLKDFQNFPCYGQEEGDGRIWLKVFFRQQPAYFGIYWVARDELEFEPTS